MAAMRILALQMLKAQPYDLAIVDMHMPGMSWR